MQKLRSFDSVVALTAFVLTILIAVVFWRGDQTYPLVKANHLSDSGQISADQKQISLTFSREMDKKSVEEHFLIDPFVPGQFSWSGKRVAYTFTQPLAYNQSYRLQLTQAKDVQGRPLKQPFEINFSTPPQTLFYINHKGQLIRYDVQKKDQEPISPESIEVLDYRMHPDRTTFYLAVKEHEEKEVQGINHFISLYELNALTGELILILNGYEAKPFEFKISPNGEWLAVTLGTLSKAGEFWVTNPSKLQLMNTKSREWKDFWWDRIYETPLYFSNDSQFLMGVDYSGDALILPLEENSLPPIQLGAYSGIHGLSADGFRLLLSKADPFLPQTSLMVRNNDGSTRMIVEGLGEISFPAFDASGKFVYFLLSHFDYEGLDYVESFSLRAYSEFFNLYRYELSSSNLQPLLKESAYAQGVFDFSADGSSVVIERYPTQMPSGEVFSMLDIFEKQTPELWWFNTQTGKVDPLYILGKKPLLD